MRPVLIACTSDAFSRKASAMRTKLLLLVSFLLLALGSPVSAHHPGADLDEMMGSEEKFFQAIDEPAAPPFELADASGNVVRLSDFSDRIVVLNFIFASCTDFCPLHSELIAEVQKKVNDTAMKDRVQFLTVTTDPARDTREVLEGHAPLHGLDARNWMFLTIKPGQPEDTMSASNRSIAGSRCTASSRTSLI